MGREYGRSYYNNYWAKMERYMGDEDLRVMKQHAMTLMGTSTASCNLSACIGGIVRCVGGGLIYGGYIAVCRDLQQEGGLICGGYRAV